MKHSNEEPADSSAQAWVDMQAADWYFRKMVRKFVTERDRISVEGVSLPCMLILRMIERDGPCRLGDLAEKMDFTSGAVTGMCDRLEKQGYAHRIRSQTDRRTVLLTITPKGKKLTERYHAVGIRCITTLFAGLNHEELSALTHIFPKIIENLRTFSQDAMKAAEICSKAIETTPVPKHDAYLHY